MQTPFHSGRAGGSYGVGSARSGVDAFLNSRAGARAREEGAAGVTPRKSAVDAARTLALQQQQQQEQQQAWGGGQSATADRRVLESEIDRLKRKLNMVIASAENVLSDASAAQETTKTQYETQLANLDAQINTLFSDNSFLRRKLEAVTKDFDSERRRVKSL